MTCSPLFHTESCTGSKFWLNVLTELKNRGLNDILITCVDSLNLPEAPLWVAVNERDQPVGFMLLSGQHMDALFIDPDVRGCGVGRMLVEHALSMAPELTTNVNEQNEQAVGFYKKVGFKVTGRSEVDDLGKPYPLLNLAYVGE